MVRRVNLTLPEDFVLHIESQKPRALTLTAFCALLIEKGLDSSGTLAERPAAEGSGASSSSSIPKSINKKNKKEGRKETIYPDAFTQFWKAYQQLPEKASKQSKPLALQAWEQATEFTPPADLQRAIEKQLTIQQQEINGRGFTVAMPDCFRWLRDECFHALLEGLDNPQSTSPSWLIK